MAGKEVARRTPAPPAPRVVQGKVVSRRTAPPRRPRRPPPPREPRPGPVKRADRGGRSITERGPQPVTVRFAPAGSYSASKMLTAELAFGFLIVAVRAVADYEPQADGTLQGKIGHPKGQLGPLPILAGLIITFFLLSFLAASGGTKAKLAVIFGGTIDLALLMKSSAEFEKVAKTFGTFGKAKVPPGSWQTSGTATGEPISGTLGGSGGGAGNGSSGGGLPKGAPPGAHPVGSDGSCPSNMMKQGAGPKGPFWCMPIAEG